MQETIYKKAVEFVCAENKASIQQLKKGLKLNYNTAADLIERMQEEGIVSEPDKKGIRKILISRINKDEFSLLKKKVKEKFYDKHPYIFYGGFASLFIILLYTPVSRNALQKETITNNPVKYLSNIEESAINKITPEDGNFYKETVDRIGKKTLEAGNRGLQKAALYTLQKEKICKTVSSSTLDISSKECSPVFAVTCNNKETYIYFKEDIGLEIDGCEVKKRKKLSDYEMITLCENHIKNYLKNPMTYKSGIFNKTSKWVNNAQFEVKIDYSAKSGFGVERGATAICDFTGYELSYFDLGLP